ncbi:MAG TPA: ABC transporter ATP-binding protein [Acetobacteraceae bacterium]|nr:ABC transporter ATP-binding protein [Acetobacteraceae bacterium]
MTLLSVRDLHVHYVTAQGMVRAVDGADLEVPAGSIVGLVGESGCGKSTLGRALMGVLPATARIAGGSIRFEGRDLVPLPERERRPLRWRRMAFVPQTAMNALDPVQRLRTQMLEVLCERGGLSRPAALDRAETLLRLVGLDPHTLADYPHQFSGGMRQRASIALALALEPALVIADEPVTALDVIVQRQVLDVLRDLQHRLNLAMILVTHDMAVVAYACDRVAVMYAGQVVESGPVAAVLEAPFHPYTMGLTHAFPDLRDDAAALVPIEGAPPSLLAPPPGCRFAERCPFAEPNCRAAPPPLATVATDHLAACWRSAAAADLRVRAMRPETWAK